MGKNALDRDRAIIVAAIEHIYQRGGVLCHVSVQRELKRLVGNYWNGPDYQKLIEDEIDRFLRGLEEHGKDS